MEDVLTLPENLDTSQAKDLRVALLARRGQALSIDGSAVERASALSIEVLVAARAQWTNDARSFTWTGLSDAFLDALQTLDLEFVAKNTVPPTQPDGGSVS